MTEISRRTFVEARISAETYAKLTAPKAEWLAMVDKSSLLDAVRQLCAAFQSADIAPPGTMMMQSAEDFERLAHALTKEVGTPGWFVDLPKKPEHTGVIQFNGILFLNPRIWVESRKGQVIAPMEHDPA